VHSLLSSIAENAQDVELRVVVVDNSCDAEEWTNLSARLQDCSLPEAVVQLVRSDSNRGYAGGNNLAYQSCRDWKPDCVFVVNPDVTFTESSLSIAATQVLANESTLFGARTLEPDGDEIGLWTMRRRDGGTAALGATESARSRTAIVYPSGHLIAASTRTWEKLAGFSEDYFLFSEEVDLVLRARELDIAVDLLSSFDVQHEVGLTTGSSPTLEKRSIATYFHASRSRIILYRKHQSLRPYLASAITARLAWSFLVQLRVGRDAAAAVRRGVREALRAPLTGGGSLR
jgi:N-acetylglucosaminyl-diphospho-decaprenol L-rhamnosyltransferase